VKISSHLSENSTPEPTVEKKLNLVMKEKKKKKERGDGNLGMDDSETKYKDLLSPRPIKPILLGEKKDDRR